MRIVPPPERGEFLRRLRERALRDAEVLVPRLGCPIYGVAEPALTPATNTAQQLVNGEWTSITLAYGARDAEAGPYLEVTTEVADAAMRAIPRARGAVGMPVDGVEAELRTAVECEYDRTVGVSAEASEPEPPVVSHQSLPAGRALVCRSGIVWAARLLPADTPDTQDAGDTADGVMVTIVGRGVTPESVRLQSLADLRPIIEVSAELTRARIESGRRQPPRPLPELEPAEGVAALLALVEVTLESSAELRASLGRPGNGRRPSRPPDWGPRRNALWQRAVREHQRLRGTDPVAADDAVTATVSHLGMLQEKAPWFVANARLRAAAIDETLSHAMIGDPVPSDPAQAAWAGYWSRRTAWSRRDLVN